MVRTHLSLPISPKYKGSVQKSAEASDSGVYKPFSAERPKRIVSDVDNKRMPTDYRKHSLPLTEVSHAMKKVCY